jgi:hypothetical protein
MLTALVIAKWVRDWRLCRPSEGSAANGLASAAFDMVSVALAKSGEPTSAAAASAAGLESVREGAPVEFCTTAAVFLVAFPASDPSETEACETTSGAASGCATKPWDAKACGTGSREAMPVVAPVCDEPEAGASIAASLGCVRPDELWAPLEALPLVWVWLLEDAPCNAAFEGSADVIE